MKLGHTVNEVHKVVFQASYSLVYLTTLKGQREKYHVTTQKVKECHNLKLV
jgi:hypothetical protein